MLSSNLLSIQCTFCYFNTSKSPRLHCFEFKHTEQHYTISNVALVYDASRIGRGMPSDRMFPSSSGKLREVAIGVFRDLRLLA